MKGYIGPDDPEFGDELPDGPFGDRSSGDWDRILMSGGCVGLAVLLMLGIVLWWSLTRPAVQVPSTSVEPLTIVIVLLSLCAVGIWVLVLLVATLIWMIWRGVPSAKSDAADPKLRERG